MCDIDGKGEGVKKPVNALFSGAPGFRREAVISGKSKNFRLPVGKMSFTRRQDGYFGHFMRRQDRCRRVFEKDVEREAFRTAGLVKDRAPLHTSHLLK